MLRHASFNAKDPQNVARILAEILAASVIRAPTPPFPAGSWFVCLGDLHGSFLEILPHGFVFDPNARGGICRDNHAPAHSGAHILVSTPRAVDEVRSIAEREHWRTELTDARLFKVVKIWIENTNLIEVLPPELEAPYASTFGTEGLLSLDAKLRQLEKPPA